MPVDLSEPNPWGLFQVHGNVWEWVEDCYVESYWGAPMDGSPLPTGACTRRALRGRPGIANRRISGLQLDSVGLLQYATTVLEFALPERLHRRDKSVEFGENGVVARRRPLLEQKRKWDNSVRKHKNRME